MNKVALHYNKPTIDILHVQHQFSYIICRHNNWGIYIPRLWHPRHVYHMVVSQLIMSLLTLPNDTTMFEWHAHGMETIWTIVLWRTRWRHQMETFSALPAICAGNSPFNGEFPAQRPVTRSFDGVFDMRLNKQLSKQSWGWWFETPSRPLWRYCYDDEFRSTTN